MGAIVGWIGHGPGGHGADVSTIAFFDDWRLACPSDTDAKTKKASCELATDAVDPKSGTRLAQITMGRELGTDNKRVMVLTVPLTVLIPPGVGLQFGTDTRTYQYVTCVPAGCVATVTLDDKLMDALSAAPAIALVVTAQNGKTVSLPVSVKGLRRIKQGTQGYRGEARLMVAEIVVMTAMHRSRSFLGRLAGATLAAVIVGATAASAQDADQQAPKKQITPTVMKTFGGWDVRCYPVSTPAPCDMWEAIAFKKGGQLAVSVSIVYVPSRDDHLLQFIVPLGVDLAKGAKIVSPSYSSDTWPYHHCDRIGCYIVVPGGNGVVEALKGLTAMTFA